MRMGELMPAYEGGPQSSGTARFARWVLSCAVRFWPEESRAWGVALATEIDETANPFEAIRWSLGGLMFFARSVLSSGWAWLKLPAGASLSGPGGPSLLPKRPRLFTAAVLAVVALLLMLPEGREALRTVLSSWHGYTMTNSDERALDKLAARAEQEKDAGTLGFVALSPSPNATRASELRASELVERTVALDPSFIWIYGAKNHRPDYHPVQKEWLERLKAADPDNAVPFLMEANALAQQKLNSLSGPAHPTDKDFENLGDDPQWMALMGRAYAAPKYDSYLQKHVQLMRSVWDRDPNLPPEIFLTGLWSHPIPDLRLIKLYAQIELNEAKKERVAGDLTQAETTAGRVAAFGERMRDSSGTVIEGLIAIAILRMAVKELAEIYRSEGKTDEARKATAHMDELEQTVRNRFGHDEPGRVARIRTLRREAALLQGFGILGGISLLAAVVGVLFLELWPGSKAAQKGLLRRAVCFAVDWAPSTLLVASGAFLVCFLPFQRVLAEFRVSSYQLTDEQRVTDAMWSLMAVPEHMLSDDSAVAFWSTLTVMLSALVVFIVAWSFYRSRRAQTQAIR